MTQLKPSEKRLLTAFGIAAFLLFNLLGFSWMKKRSLVLERQRITLETRSRELAVWKTRAGEAELKRAFLEQHLQVYPDEAFRETYLDSFILRQVEDLDLEVRKNLPLPVKLEPLFHKSRYTAEVVGEWDNILEFIYRLQSPKEFRFVPRISLKSQKKEGSTAPAGEEAPNVVCTFEIEKWWSPQSATDVTTEETPAETPAPATTTATDAAPASPAIPPATPAPLPESTGTAGVRGTPVPPGSSPQTAATEQSPGTPVKTP